MGSRGRIHPRSSDAVDEDHAIYTQDTGHGTQYMGPSGRIHPRSCGAVAPMDVVLCLAFIDSHIIINYLIHQILILCKILKKRIPFW